MKYCEQCAKAPTTPYERYMAEFKAEDRRLALVMELLELQRQQFMAKTFTAE